MTNRNSEKFIFQLSELTLWRDGHKAVVSLTIASRVTGETRTVRLLEADCRQMFFETIGAAAVKAASFGAAIGMRNWRWRNGSRPKRPGPELELAAE